VALGREEEADHGEAVMTVRGWTLGIDWSGHGTFTEPLEDATSRLDDQDLTVTIGRESEKTTGHSQTASLAFALQNSDRALMPEYSASPIFGNVGPSRKVTFSGTAGTSTVNLLTGVLDGYTIDYAAVDYSFGATVLDGWGRPGAEKLSTPLYTGIRTGDAISVILDAIGWPGARSIDPGATCMPFWWAEGDDAASAVNKLVDAEGLPAIAYVQGNTFYFRDRHHRILNARSVASQALVTQIYPQNTGPGSDLKIKTNSFSYDDGLKSIINSVSFAVDLRAPTNPMTVWSTDSPISLATGEVQVVFAAASDPFFNATVSVSTRTGTVTATLDRDNGASVAITLTCVSAAVIDSITVTANSVPVVRTVKVESSDVGSIGNFGAQNWPNDSPPFANQYDAQAIADRLVAVYATRRPSLTFTLAGYTPALLASLLGLLVSDRITVRNDIGGINADFIIERLVYLVRNLDLLELTVGCQVVDPVQPDNLFQFDVAGHGFNQGEFGIVGIDSATTMFRFDVAGQGFDQGVFAT
jgi:hypothetical protein